MTASTSSIIGFAADIDELLGSGADSLFCVGSVAALQAAGAALLPEPLAAATAMLVEGLTGSAFKPSPASTAIVGGGGSTTVKKLVLVPLAESVTRYISPAQSFPITDGLSSAGIGSSTGHVAVLLLPSKAEYAPAAALGLARALPAYTKKTKPGGPTGVTALISASEGVGAPAAATAAPFLQMSPVMATALRRAQMLADSPAEEVNTSQFEQAAIAAVGDCPGVTITSIEGDQLLEEGLNAICAWLTTLCLGGPTLAGCLPGHLR
eukprot:COSAG01_NODE_5115_length_4474_cov_4.309943_1_plen_266_part_00